MVPSLAVLNQYLYGKKEFLGCSSSAMKQVCLPVWEAAFCTSKEIAYASLLFKSPNLFTKSQTMKN